MYTDITGIILSGGKSTRMGVNKSLLKVGDKTIIEYVCDLMQSIFSKVILITNDPEEYGFLALDIFEDVYKGYGPLAGIHSGLINSPTNKNFFISCDVPLMTKDMIKYIVDFPTNKKITIAKADGFIQQLVGTYNRDINVSIEETFKSQLRGDERDNNQHKRGCRVLSLIDKVGAEIINAESLPFYKPGTYFNMNKQDDFNFVKEKLNQLLASKKV